MKSTILPFLLLALACQPCLSQNKVLKGIVLNKSNSAKPEAEVHLIPLDDANDARKGSDGKFSLTFQNKKAGDPVTLLVEKAGFQVLGFNEKEFTCVLPADPEERVKIALVRTDEFDRRVANITSKLEKRIAEQGKKIDSLIVQRRSASVSDAEREALTAQITTLYQQAQQLEANKAELAKRFAQTDLDEASSFVRDALKKFEEGDVKAALALMSQEKIDEFWDNVLGQEEKVQRAKAQGVENYMIRARMLVADFQFKQAEENYLKAIAADSMNLDNLWEAAYFLVKQNDYQPAMRLYRKALALASSESTRAALLNNLGALLYANQSFAEAETAYREALKIRKALAEKNPGTFLPDVAASLNNLGNLLKANQSFAEAEAAYRGALKIRRALAEKNPDAFLPDVAMSLNNLGALLYANQSFGEAEAAYREALKIYRALADKNPDAFLNDVAMTLNNLGALLFTNQSFAEAEVAFREVLKIRRALAEKNPDAFLPDLAGNLDNLGTLLSYNLSFAEADTAYREALKIRRALAEKNPDAFLPGVAESLNNLGLLLKANQSFGEAEAVYREALKIRRALAEKN
ncbi:MAG: tetratricopeptide repeat protein, partial [Saprospiraceae bacterium]